MDNIEAGYSIAGDLTANVLTDETDEMRGTLSEKSFVDESTNTDDAQPESS